MSLSEKIANAESSDWLCKGMADEEVIKIISEAKKEARGRIKLIDTLDKIKAEILDEAEYAYADFNKYKEDILHAESDELPDDDFRYGLEKAVEIINKYKRGV